MASILTPSGLAHTSARHPWPVLAFWGVLVVAAMMLMGAYLTGALTNEADISANPDSKRGANLLEEKLRGPMPANEAVIIRNEAMTVDQPAFRAYVEGLYGDLNALGPDVIASGTTFYQSQLPGLVSTDGHTTIIPLVLAGDMDHATENIGDILKIVEGANGEQFEVYVSGSASVGEDFGLAAERDIARGETIGGLIALIILVLVFGAGTRAISQGSFWTRVWTRTLRGVSAAAAPMVLAVMAIICALGVTALVGREFQFSFFVQNMISMMGLAVGIDYALFIVSRYREERDHGRPVLEAIDVAQGTSGRAVFFSGLTVIIALSGMLIVPSTIYRSLAAGAIFVVAFAILASLTLLPALLRLFGDSTSSWFSRRSFSKALAPVRSVLRVAGMVLLAPVIAIFAALEGLGGLLGHGQTGQGEEHGFWDKVAQTVMRHPVVGVVSVTTLLVLLAIPYFDINAGSAGVSTLPETFQSKKGFDILAEDFAGGAVYPAEIVVDGPSGPSSQVPAAFERLQASLRNDPVFGPATFETNQAGDLGLISVQMAVDPYTDAANAGVERLREQHIPAAFNGVPVEVYVTGLTALNVDALDMTASYTPIVFAFVLGLSFVLLMLVFRSIVVPAKAIVMNLLSVGAAYGLIVLVSQKGFAADILGFQQVDTVEFWLPLFLFSVLFGLSMDYHVFLLSRIRERYDLTGNNTDAVAYGLRTTGRLITGAALIMVAVFGGFAMGELVMLQQVGFGLGVAVLIDATVIRSILVPSSMRLLGKWNWYLPPVLSWLPHLGIEAPEPHVPESRRSPEPVGSRG